MKEIGGYIELDTYTGPMLHDRAIKLNCARNALAYLIETKNIRRIALPKFMCDSCNDVLTKYGVQVRRYSIGSDFKPTDTKVEENEWFYLVNYYGQLSSDYVKTLKQQCERIIVDHAQAYFQMNEENVDTLYSCRKFFGLADGAILYTDKKLERVLPVDESFNRMHFLLGRFERTASEFYGEFVANNDYFITEPLKQMSKLTENLLHGIDYERVKQRRTENFAYLHERLERINKLNLSVPEGAFMYPLYIENGSEIRKKLQDEKIYIPTLWPDVFEICDETELEYDMAKNILPLPVDQRYDESDMRCILTRIEEILA